MTGTGTRIDPYKLAAKTITAITSRASPCAHVQGTDDSAKRIGRIPALRVTDTPVWAPYRINGCPLPSSAARSPS